MPANKRALALQISVMLVTLLVCIMWCLCYAHQLFTSNLVTRSAAAENATDADRSVAAVEHTRVAGIAERQTFDSSESTFCVLQIHMMSIITYA